MKNDIQQINHGKILVLHYIVELYKRNGSIITKSEILSGTRKENVLIARTAAIIILHQAYKAQPETVMKVFKKDRTTFYNAKEIHQQFYDQDYKPKNCEFGYKYLFDNLKINFATEYLIQNKIDIYKNIDKNFNNFKEEINKKIDHLQRAKINLINSLEKFTKAQQKLTKSVRQLEFEGFEISEEIKNIINNGL